MKKQLLFFLLMLTVAKLSAQLNHNWVVGIGSGCCSESVYDMKADQSGNILIAGSYSGWMDFDPDTGVVQYLGDLDGDIFILKLDENAAFKWVYQVGDDFSEMANGITTDNSGNIFSTGKFMGAVDFDPTSAYNILQGPFGNCFILKLDSIGNYLWAKSPSGGYCTGNSIACDGEDIYITGAFGGTVDFDFGPDTNMITSMGQTDVFILKLDSGGNFLWVKQFGGSNADEASEILLDDSANIFLSGYFTDTAYYDPGMTASQVIGQGYYDSFILKLDSTGNLLWSQTIGSDASETGDAIALNDSGNVFMATVYSDTLMVNTLSGINTFYTQGYNETLICKYDDSGNIVWAKSTSGSYSDNTYSILVDPSGNVYTYLQFYDTCDLDPGAGNFNVISNGQSDIAIQILDANGNFINAYHIGGVNGDQPKAITWGNNNSLYATGVFTYIIDFDPGPSIDTLQGNFNDVYIQKFSTSMVNLNEIEKSEMNIYPNPATNYITIRLEKQFTGTMRIFDATGKIILLHTLENQNLFKVTTNFSPGFYIAELVDANGRVNRKKFIVH